MIHDHDLPVSNDRLTGELKAAVIIVLFGLVALGLTEALVGRHDAPVTPAPARAAGKAPAQCEIPGKPTSVLSEIGPLAPMPRSPCPTQPKA